MTGNEYQEMAMRTCSIPYDHRYDRLTHGVLGLCSETQEFNEAFRDYTQGLETSSDHSKKELGDITWMIAEILVAIESPMTPIKEYAELNTRSRNCDIVDSHIAREDMRRASAEIADILQKVYQGHQRDDAKIRLESERAIRCVAVLATFLGTSLDEVMTMNIAKLKKRYPEGFTPFRSMNRVAGDV